jgi:hypothetical protein
VTCSDETKTADEEFTRIDIGEHVFSISRAITISEKYDQKSNNNRNGRKQANGCAHKEQSIKLADNEPCAVKGLCVCY